jgi:phage terminase large subunit
MNLTKKQSTALKFLNDDITTEVLFGGGAGGGKSAFGCYWILKCAIMFPSTRWLIGRAVLKTLKETTLVTLFEVMKMQGLVESVHYKLNSTSSTVNLWNGSQILLKDLFQYPSDLNFDELGSLEITGVFVDEANQISEKCKNILKSRIRFKLDEFNLIPKILYTCNPAKNWTYQQFYTPHKEGKLDPKKKFIQSLVGDNPHISRHYIENLKTLDNVSRERLLFGNWEFDNDPSKLIEFESIMNIFTNEHVLAGKKFITCDVARYGNDSTTILVWSGFQIISFYILKKSSTTDTAERIKELAKLHSIPMSQIVCDEDGVGGGLVDQLKCKGFLNGSKPLNDEQFINLKSQCYFKLSDAINANRISWIDIDIVTRQKLIEELEQVKRKDVDKDGKLAVIPKDKIKELIGRSPDISDSMMMRMFFELAPSTTIRSKSFGS